MLLENGNIRLRAVEPEDLDRLYSWENNTRLWDVGNTRNPYSRYILKQYIINSDKDIYENKQLRLMIVSGKFLEPMTTEIQSEFETPRKGFLQSLFGK